MALINHAKREINAKIVYYGREGTGKRESLQYIYDRIKPALKGGLKSPTNSGETLFFFDFSPFEAPVFGDYRLRFHVYTLTGTVANPAAWKMTLKGADGLVIVADADQSGLTASRESILALRDYLAAYGVGLNETPCVIQIVNGTDKGDSASETVASSLGIPGVQAFFSDPVHGAGVLDALSRLSRLVMTRIGQDDALKTVAVVDAPEPAPVIASDSTVPAALEPESAALSVTEEKDNVTPVHEVNAGCSTSAVKIAVSGNGAQYGDGLVKIPLELTIAGVTRHLLFSLAIEEV